jgi:ribosomal protein S18 acetylase RimI-like enzyme
MKYQTRPEGISVDALVGGFFEVWSNPPKVSVGGFIIAVSDGVSSACIPHVEVRPEFRGRGIGTELVKRMLDQLKDMYMIDLCCDGNVVAFYDALGFRRVNGMVIRNHERQLCSSV